MASTITRHADAPGQGAFTKLMAAGARQLKIRTFDLDITSYAAGGEDISSIVNEFAGSTALFVLAQSKSATPGAVFQYDPATKKLKAFWTGAAVSTALAEVTAATDLNQVGVMVIGY